jgi:hypothetical protein
VGVLPPSELRFAVLAPALFGVPLVHEAAGVAASAIAALLDEAAARGVLSALAALFAADAAVGRLIDSGGLGVLIDADTGGTATLGVGFTTPREALGVSEVSEGATFSSMVAATAALMPPSAAEIAALVISLVGSFVKPAGLVGRTGAGC